MTNDESDIKRYPIYKSVRNYNQFFGINYFEILSEVEIDKNAPPSVGSTGPLRY